MAPKQLQSLTQASLQQERAQLCDVNSRGAGRAWEMDTPNAGSWELQCWGRWSSWQLWH